MSRYTQTFSALKAKNEIAFVPFWMLGDPEMEQSQVIIERIAAHADILELGIPFSDPLADGPTLQASANRALDAGATPKKCLETVRNIRQKFPDKPIGLLVYLNLVMQFGINDFFATCKEVGVDSVLIPELPVEEIELVEKEAQAHEIDLIFLVSTNTPEDRLEKILEKSGGFIYAISKPSITGAQTDIAPETLAMVKDLKQKTNLPICVGFGVSSPEHVEALKDSQADGAIIGSKLFDYREDPESLEKFCESCKAKTG